MGSCSSKQQKRNVVASSRLAMVDVMMLPKAETPSDSPSELKARLTRPLSSSTDDLAPNPAVDEPPPPLDLPLIAIDGRSSFGRKYKVRPSQDILGRGCAGQVRECVDRNTSEPRAVKIIDKSRIRRREDRLKREIEFLREVRHPNVIRMYDAYENEKTVRIVTELCRGSELFYRIADKSKKSKERSKSKKNKKTATWPACFEERSAARIVRSLLSAVSYLHSKDIVHRDIKPENVLFQEENDDDQSPVKLIDFGLSVRHAEGAHPLRSRVGTPYYMAPEVLDGEYDRACDLWSIGVVTYVMLTGRPPFNGRTDDDIFEKIREGTHGLSDDASSASSNAYGVSEDAKDFVRKLLVRDPRDRCTAAMVLEHPWLQAECNLPSM